MFDRCHFAAPSFLACLMMVGVGRAEEMPRRDLEGFLELAVENGLALGPAQAQVAHSETREAFVSSKAFPRVTVQLLGGPSPTVSGDALNSKTDWGDWGYAFQSKIEIVQPLYSFGALSKAKQAAAAATEAERGAAERERWKLRSELAKYYFGYQFAFEMEGVATQAEKELQDALKKTRRATEIDQLKTYVYEAQVRISEAQKGMDQARLGMAWKTGVYAEQSPRWQRANLKRPEQSLEDLEVYQRLAREHRIEHKALAAESRARSLYADAEAARLWPTVFVAGQYVAATSNARTDQASAFAHDPYNEHSVALGVGLRWNVLGTEQRAKVAMLRAEALKAQAQERLYRPGLAAEVEKTYLDLKHAQKAASLRAEAEASARRVLMDRYGGFRLGNTTAKDLLESLAVHVLARKSALEAIYEENLAWVQLEAAVGRKILSSTK